MADDGTWVSPVARSRRDVRRRRPAGCEAGGRDSQARRTCDPSDTRQRAQAIAAKLGHEIAATSDRRAVPTKTFEHPVVVESHRDHHAYHSGSDMFYGGLATGDALARIGLPWTGPGNVARLLIEAARP